jgi:hypothetical protein
MKLKILKAVQFIIMDGAGVKTCMGTAWNCGNEGEERSDSR